MKELPNNSIDLVITDPPYKFENKGGGFYSENKSTKRKYLDNLRKENCIEFNPINFLNLINQKCKKFYAYIFCNKSLIIDYLKYAIQNEYKYDLLTMTKKNPMPTTNNSHLPDLEYIVLIRKGGTYFSDSANFNDYRKNYNTSCKKRKHPAQKDVEIIERFIRLSSKKDDVILDPFMGSGTTAIACKKLNRNFIGYDDKSKWVNLAYKRLGKIDKSYYNELPKKERPKRKQLF